MRSALSPSSRDPRAADLLRAAFRDVHGPRLHGFAQLLTLGDPEWAASLAATALSAGAARAADLRHPERAAAWLRARVVREVRRRPSATSSASERRSVLSNLGVADAAAEALAELQPEERAALIAAMIERFDIGDVATILGREIADVRQLLGTARARYLRAATHWMDSGAPHVANGHIGMRLQEAAAWAVGAGTQGGGAHAGGAR